MPGTKRARKGAGARRDRVSAEPTGKDFLGIWAARKVEKSERERRECATIEIEFGGVPCVARRMPLIAWVRAGQLPSYLALAFVESLEKGRPVAPRQPTAEDEEEAARFRRMAVCETTVKPKIVYDREPQAGEISYEQVLADHPEFIFEMSAWILAGCPEIKVKTEGGALTTDELGNFRERKVVPGTRKNGSAIWWETEPTPRIAR